MNPAPRKMNPFPGLRPFTQAEDFLFFGREEQTIELLQRLSSNRFVAVVGTSGSGKSSLVRCGLLSELLGGGMLGAGAAWEIAITHPGGNPLALLTDALLEAEIYDREVEHARENLLATLSRSHFGLVEAVKQAELGAGTNFLLVVDQFEEIFRFHEAGQRQQEVANEFVSLLLEAASQQEVPIYVVLTMRSDFIGECSQFEGLAEMVNRGEFLIPRLTREQYKRVIEGPIKVAGGQIAPRLLQRLLNDLGQQADQLPCLQHALMRTWDVWAGSGDTEALDLHDYQRVGKMSQALSLHADEIYESLASDRQRALCQGIFQALTIEESSGRGIRRPQRLGRLCQILEVPDDELRPIIDAYRQSGVTFLMPSPEVELTEQSIIDISHESLMRVWTQLRQWVEEETQAAGIYHRLSESAVLHQQGKAGLYRDPELGIALAWREAKRPNAAWADRYRPGFATAMGFLEASQQASVAEKQSREAARQRDIEQTQRLAESQQLRLEQQQRSARKLRAMIGGLAVVAIVAGIACVAALIANDRANKLRIVASHEAENAQQNAVKAEQSALEAIRLREAAQQAEQAMERAATQAAADRNVAQRESYRSTIKLAESMLQGDDEARFRVADILWQTQPELRAWEWGHLMARCPLEEWSLQTDDSGLQACSATADGRCLVTAGGNGLVTLWNLQARQPLWQQKTGLVYKLSVDPMNRFVGVSAADNSLPQFRILDLATGKVVHESEQSGKVDLAFSASGKEFYVLDNRGTLRCVATSTWEQRAQAEITGLFDFSGRLLEVNTLFVDAAGGYVGVFCSYSETMVPMFRFFDAQTLGATSQLAGFQEQATNLKSHSTPMLNSALGEMSFSFTTAVYRKSLDGNANLVCENSDYVKLLTMDPVSGAVLAATANGAVQIVDADGGKQTILHGAPIAGLATLPQGRFITAGADGLVKCWNLTRPGILAFNAPAPTEGAASAVFVEFTSDGQSLLFRTWDRHNLLYDIDSLSYRHFVFPDRGGHVKLFPLIRPRTNELVADGRDGLLFFPQSSTGIDAESTKFLAISSPSSAAFDAAGRLLVVGSSAGKLAVFDLESARQLPTPQVQGVGSVAINASGTRAALRTKEGLQVWDVATGRLLNNLDIVDNGTTPLPPVFHPDSELIAVVERMAGSPSKMILWDSILGRPSSVVLPPSGIEFRNCRFSPDGQRLFAQCTDQKVHVLDWRLGKVLIALTGEKNVERLAVSPDGLSVAYAGFSPSLRIAKSLPWQGEVARDTVYYRAVDDLRLYTAKTARRDSQDKNSAIEEMLGDVARRQGRYDDALAHYTTAITVETEIVLKDPSKAAPQGRLAILFLKQLAVSAENNSGEAMVLQPAAGFWQNLMQNQNVNPVGWRHLLDFQLRTLNQQIATGSADSGQHLTTLLSFWSNRSEQEPANRLFAYGLSEVIRRVLAVYPDGVDQELLDKLTADDPGMVAVFGDIYSEQQDWPHAIAIYSRGIQKGSPTPDLFAKRARAYEQQQDWEAAAADWLRAIQQQPGLTQAVFDRFKQAKRWSEAAQFGLKLVEQKPDDTMVWLPIAPVLVLAEDQAAYSGFCGRMAQRFAQSNGPDDAERVIKVSLLRANSIDFAKLPGDRLAKSLDDGTVPDGFLPWGWGTRALLAYRGGDAESAVKYVTMSQEHKPNDFAQAMNFAVLALAQHQLQHPEDARRALKEASQLITRLQADDKNKGGHDLLIAQILFREAEALTGGKIEPMPPGAATTLPSPADEKTLPARKPGSDTQPR